MTKILKVLTLLSIIVLIPIAIAKEPVISELSGPGTTPDSVFYGLDKAIEKIDLALTFDKKERIMKNIEIASERLSELKIMTEKNDPPRPEGRGIGVSESKT